MYVWYVGCSASFPAQQCGGREDRTLAQDVPPTVPGFIDRSRGGSAVRLNACATREQLHAQHMVCIAHDQRGFELVGAHERCCCSNGLRGCDAFTFDENGFLRNSLLDRVALRHFAFAQRIAYSDATGKNHARCELLVVQGYAVIETSLENRRRTAVVLSCSQDDDGVRLLEHGPRAGQQNKTHCSCPHDRGSEQQPTNRAEPERTSALFH